MSLLPPASTPLNQHSLRALEEWLRSLGAEKSEDDPCVWLWQIRQCSAQIVMKQDELRVIWIKDDESSQLSFTYGLPRQDVEAALKQGP